MHISNIFLLLSNFHKYSHQLAFQLAGYTRDSFTVWVNVRILYSTQDQLQIPILDNFGPHVEQWKEHRLGLGKSSISAQTPHFSICRILFPSDLGTIRFVINISAVLKCISSYISRKVLLWGCWIVWCILTSRYLVSLLPVSIIHVSDIFLVGFWSWGISFIMWGCQRAGAGRQPGLGFRFPVKWWDSPPPSGDLEPANQYAPSKKPVGELKSPRAPKFEQKPTPFVPIELL